SAPLPQLASALRARRSKPRTAPGTRRVAHDVPAAPTAAARGRRLAAGSGGAVHDRVAAVCAAALCAQRQLGAAWDPVPGLRALARPPANRLHRLCSEPWFDAAAVATSRG